jgi:hypothetical protein
MQGTHISNIGDCLEPIICPMPSHGHSVDSQLRLQTAYRVQRATLIQTVPAGERGRFSSIG